MFTLRRCHLELLPEYINLSNKVDKLTKDFEELSNMDNVVKCGKQIRKKITDLQDSLPWPPQSRDLAPDKFQIPQRLDVLLKTEMKSRPARLDFLLLKISYILQLRVELKHQRVTAAYNCENIDK